MENDVFTIEADFWKIQHTLGKSFGMASLWTAFCDLTWKNAIDSIRAQNWSATGAG